MNMPYEKTINRASILIVHTVYLLGVSYVVSQGHLWAAIGFVAAVAPQAWLIYNIRFNPKMKDLVAWEDWEIVTIFASILAFVVLALSLSEVSTDGRVFIVVLCNIFGWVGTIGVRMDAKSLLTKKRSAPVEDY